MTPDAPSNGTPMSIELLLEQAHAQVGSRRAVPTGRTATDKRRADPKVLDVATIMAMDVRSPQLLIEAFMPIPGAVLLVGGQKTGKTVLAVQAGIAVSTGHAMLENYRIVQPGPVLILEADDPAGAASMKDYLSHSSVQTKDAPLYLVTQAPFPFGPDFHRWLHSRVTEMQLKLVVLDSYTALRPSRGRGCDIVKIEHSEMIALDSLGKHTGCTVLIITHDSKGSFGMDWSERTAGTFAIGAAVEGQIHISRFHELPSNAHERLIRIRGRHFQGTEAVLRFRPDTLDYEMVLEGSSASLYAEAILPIAEAFRDTSFTPKELYQQLGFSRQTATRLISHMVFAGALTRLGRGEYQIPPNLFRKVAK
jgi:hypothetical protein